MIGRDLDASSLLDRCPRCEHRLKSWKELSDDERFLAERLPASADFTLETRKKHRFCTRCWFEDRDRNSLA